MLGPQVESLWDAVYFEDFFFYVKLFQVLMTNVISKFFIKIVSQFDVPNSVSFLAVNSLYQFYARHRYQFFHQLVFWCIPASAMMFDFLFGFDYFL